MSRLDIDRWEQAVNAQAKAQLPIVLRPETALKIIEALRHGREVIQEVLAFDANQRDYYPSTLPHGLTERMIQVAGEPPCRCPKPLFRGDSGPAEGERCMLCGWRPA